MSDRFFEQYQISPTQKADNHRQSLIIDRPFSFHFVLAFAKCISYGCSSSLLSSLLRWFRIYWGEVCPKLVNMNQFFGTKTLNHLNLKVSTCRKTLLHTCFGVFKPWGNVSQFGARFLNLEEMSPSLGHDSSTLRKRLPVWGTIPQPWGNVS